MTQSKGQEQSNRTQELLEKASKRGYITSTEILEAFPQAEKDLPQLEELFVYLHDRGIEIYESEEEAEEERKKAEIGEPSALVEDIEVALDLSEIAADDTISIGAVEYTWKASASGDDEITLSFTEATAATNFAAKINADARWTGILSASVATATVTLTWLADPRLCQHILVTYAETNAGSVVPAGTVIITGAEAPLIGSTVTGQSAIRNWGQGAAT